MQDFVDLAGSERASQTLSVNTRLKEGCHINRSLLALGTCIRKLRLVLGSNIYPIWLHRVTSRDTYVSCGRFWLLISKGRNGHIPYRDSKLTRILQNSLGGNARTAIICTMSPAHSQAEQSRNTLMFATCAKQVSTNAHVNMVMTEKALVRQLQSEVERLETELRNLSAYTTPAMKEKEALIEKVGVSRFQLLVIERTLKYLTGLFKSFRWIEKSGS